MTIPFGYSDVYEQPVYAVMADATVALHASFIVFVIGGQCLILLGWWRDWRWPRGFVFRSLHLLAILFVVLEAWFGILCPLTLLESHFRELAGGAGHPGSFVGYWLHRLIFYQAPSWVFTVAYTAFAGLVVASFVAYPPVVKRQED